LKFNIKKLVEEDINNCFSEDPNNRFYKSRCYDFVKKIFADLSKFLIGKKSLM